MVEDVVDDVPPLTCCARPRSGIRGSVVVHGRVTDVLDVPALLAAAGLTRRVGVAA